MQPIERKVSELNSLHGKAVAHVRLHRRSLQLIQFCRAAEHRRAIVTISSTVEKTKSGRVWKRNTHQPWPTAAEAAAAY